MNRLQLEIRKTEIFLSNSTVFQQCLKSQTAPTAALHVDQCTFEIGVKLFPLTLVIATKVGFLFEITSIILC